MKTITLKLIVIFAAICGGFHAAATTRTVNNSTSLPVNPGQYTSIASAIGASSSGDTILVAGSLIIYDPAGFAIDRKIVLLGSGYNPDVQNPRSTIVGGGVSFTNFAADGSLIMGFQFNSTVTCSFFNPGTFSDITFRRNYFAGNFGFGPFAGGFITINNFLIAENIFSAGNTNACSFPGATNGMVISNNLFIANSQINLPNGVGVSPVVIDHNLFLAGSHFAPLKSGGLSSAITARNAIISNNIFYNIFPTDTSISTGNTNNDFLNNITYAGITYPAMPYYSNIGSSNINNTDPLFTTLFSSSINPSLDLNFDNLRPQSGSPVINAGNDATNIGPTGGIYPIYHSTNTYLTGEPPIPEIKQMNYITTSAVNQGTPIGIQVKAKKIN